ncbi:MAG: hypothetical protein E7620_01915 [Ruminococcaceae bacterium]|nr:hypothetical protein [Oscillospiraceae bacterium]
MQTSKNSQTKRTGRPLAALTTWLLLIALLVQSLSLGCMAAISDISSLLPGSSGSSGSNLTGQASGIGHFQSDEVIAKLKKDFLQSINQDLIQKVDELKLTGSVGVILSFSENSLINTYSSSSASKSMSYREFSGSAEARRLQLQLQDNQKKVLSMLQGKGLISEVKYTYSSIMDGAYVTTTFEQLDEIAEIPGVERITISDTYEAAAAVENPVNVYDTGIFNSSDISYTGKGTIVAILDTGCDYTHTAFTSHQVVSPLYDRDDIADMLPKTMAYSYDPSLEAREVYYGNITGNKIAFGYDYADRDADIMPFSNEHGTHVAGIIGGMDDTITGVAIDTQLAIMKVFSDYEVGADDGDILAALEDSIILGVDAINMSLGTSCGFTREADDDYKNTLYDNIERAGISLIVAASNDYSSAFGSEGGNTNKTDNPDSSTVGAPSTYKAALSVASINGNKDRYMLANGTREVFFHESVNQNAKEYDFFAMMGITADNPTEFEYVSVPGFGLAINYAGLDMNGKIALVRRGDITFEEKVQFAYEAGAIAVIIYNNVFGDIMMTIGNDAKIPAVSIGKDDGDLLAMQPGGTLLFDINNLAGPFMSDFSSWGPNPDLTLKPEITAHGGNILSAIVGGGYDKLSGTSMAAPNMCGITVLIRQYVKEKYPNLTAEQVRDLVNQLCMSTATIALDRNGNPYSPRKQGAGIADILKATTTDAYLLVEGSGKTKLELGDDPHRSGVYIMTIQLKNLSDAAVSYKLGNIAMTESVSTSDPEVVAEIGYLLSNSTSYAVANGTLENGILTVPAGGCASVTATITLSKEDKAYLNANFANGMFIEGFLTFENTRENGVDLNAPFLAFYGDWGEAPIFDLDYYEVETEAHNNAIDDDDKIKADYYPTTPAGSYYYDYILPLGSYVYQMDESEYTPIPATREHAAISYYQDAISGIYGVFAGLLRGAKELNITISNATTGEVVWTETKYDCPKAHYNGSPYPYVAMMDIPMANYKTGEVFGYNNAKYEVTLSAKADWNGGSNDSDSYSFSFYIDYQAPTVTDAYFYSEYDKTLKENRYYVDLTVYDNHYAMSVRPIIAYEFTNPKGELERTYASLSNNPIPVYQENRGESTKVKIEITDYIDRIASSANPEGITFFLDDYAMNSNICFVPFPETKNSELEFIVPSMDLDINQTFDLTTYLARPDSDEAVTVDYLKTLTWTSSDESVVAVHNGQIQALKSGSATVSVTGSTWTYTETVNGEKVEKPLYRTIVINVSGKEADVEKPQIESLDFSSYYTLFAFNSDIDYSEIGITGSTGYFGKSASLSFYPSEQVQLFYQLKPWNLTPDRYTLKWSSSNPKVATVDENGIVTAESEGRARITLQITIDGKTSLLAARCSVEVKSEFIIENRMLVAYKGKGGDVVIPDDEGITIIGSFAFSHFDMDNKKEVEKDENGYYDIDEKKEPIGNKTLTSVVIPEDVETIEKYAFYNCELLRNVTLPTSCKTINQYAFYNCERLENVNFDNVHVINDYAFYNCNSLACEDLGGVNLAGVTSIGAYAFAKTRLKSVTLSNLSLSGKGSFAECAKLETVVLGQRTRISESMFEGSAVTSVEIFGDSIADSSFKNCSKLTQVTLSGDLTYLGSEAFRGCKRLTTVTFNKVCEIIGAYAFADCTSLKSFTLPNNALTLSDGCFSSSALNTLIFAENTRLTQTGAGLFEKLSSITFNLNASNPYVLSNGVVYTKDMKTLVLAVPGAVSGTFTVPASVTTIAPGAFSANNGITDVRFEAGSQLKEIGDAAFALCPILTTVTLPERAVRIGNYAFFESNMLSSLNTELVTFVGEFAFENTALTTVTFRQNNLILCAAAFYGCPVLKTVVIEGSNAIICDYAFCQTGVTTVRLTGNGVTVGEGAFMECKSLRSFDFEALMGTVGNTAFFGCTGIVSVNMPNVTELGVGAFADCPNLKHFSAENLAIVGMNAFAPYDENAFSGASFTTIYAPNLRSIGESAFYGCIYLTEIDLSKATSVSSTAFAFCENLKRVTLSETLTALPELVFYGCTALTEIDLSNLVRIGMGAFYGVPLPKTLNLEKAEYIDASAFIEMEEQGLHYVEFVNAPNLLYVGDQAFAACKKLRGFYAPKLEHIGAGAFALTALEEFEIPSTLKEMGFSAFEGADSLKSFYATVDGKKLTDHQFDHIMIKDGVLYRVIENGYELSCYPAAKTDSTFTVAEGTVRIEYCAVMLNKYLEKVILPESLRVIGNYAFYLCENLDTFVFRSYYAPDLEGTMSEEIGINKENVDQFPGFDQLYAYDYYFYTQGILGTPFYYSNFIGTVGSVDAQGLTCVLPDNCEGYDSMIYRAYFTVAEETSGATAGKFAIAFTDAAKKLPAVTDRFDKLLVDAAIVAYNALEGHPEELAVVDQALIDRFQKARSEYLIDVAEDKIAHLFDLDCSEYAFEAVKEAKEAFEALSKEEQALVENAPRLSAKLEELTVVMGMEPDFNRPFREHFPEEPTPEDPPVVEPPVENKKDPTLLICIALAAVVVLVITLWIVTAVIDKKRNAKRLSAEKSNEQAPAEEAASEEEEKKSSLPAYAIPVVGLVLITAIRIVTNINKKRGS